MAAPLVSDLVAMLLTSSKETGLLVLDALCCQQCNTVSANSQALQQHTLPPEKSLDWMRQDSEQQLAEMLSQAFDMMERQYGCSPRVDLANHKGSVQ